MKSIIKLNTNILKFNNLSIFAIITLYFFSIELFAFDKYDDLNKGINDNSNNFISHQEKVTETSNIDLTYHRIKIYIKNQDELNKIWALGFDNEGIEFNKNYVILIVNSSEYQEIIKQDFSFEIINENYSQMLTKELEGINFNQFLNKLKQNELRQNEIKQNQIHSQNEKHNVEFTSEDIPQNFNFGSYFNYHTLDEIYAEFEKMRSLYPSFITKEEFGKSIENRPLYVWKFNFTNKSNVNKSLITALHHAREPITASTLIYTAWYLIESYFSNESLSHNYIVNLLQNGEVHFVPCLNPDGYLINTNSAQAGLWRKNTRVINGKVTGVDLNRNYGPNEFWNFKDTTGSSTNANFDTYRGQSEFSEPETRAIRDLANKYKYINGLNFHSFGQIVITPNLSIKTEEQSKSFESYGVVNYKNTKYTFGTDSMSVGYRTRGNSDDWFYQTNDKSYSTFALTPELDEAFYQKDSIKILKSIIHGKNYILTLLNSLYKYPVINQYEIKNNNGKLALEIQIENIGFVEIKSPKIRIKRNFQENFIENNITQSLIRNQKVFSIFDFDIFDLNDADTTIIIEIYDDVELLSKVEQKLNLAPFKTTKYFESIFSTDDLKNTFNFYEKSRSVEFEESNWGIELKNNKSSITDSKNQNYDSLSYNYLRSKNPIQFKKDTKFELILEASWQIERNYDHFFVRLFDSTTRKYYYLENEFTKSRYVFEKAVLSLSEYPIFEGYFQTPQILRFDVNTVVDKLSNTNNIYLEIGVVSDKSKNYDGINIYRIELLEFEKNKKLSIQNTNNNQINSLIINDEIYKIDFNKLIGLNELDKAENYDTNNFKFSLTDNLGSDLTHYINSNGAELTIKFENNGIYFLQIHNSNNIIRTIKILKVKTKE